MASVSFQEAVNTLHSMFSGVDRNVCADVLRANRGHMEDSVDALLALTTEDSTPSAMPPPSAPPSSVEYGGYGGGGGSSSQLPSDFLSFDDELPTAQPSSSGGAVSSYDPRMAAMDAEEREQFERDAELAAKLQRDLDLEEAAAAGHAAANHRQYPVAGNAGLAGNGGRRDRVAPILGRNNFVQIYSLLFLSYVCRLDEKSSGPSMNGFKEKMASFGEGVKKKFGKLANKIKGSATGSKKPNGKYQSLSGADALDDDDDEEEELVAFRPGASTNEVPSTLHARTQEAKTFDGWKEAEEADDEALFSQLGRGVENKKDR
uniref:CUE domain-containing protein n=1 Tax=Palpitomonas bilix TaxID=652834 RepID=A0A7S3GIE5_9EUKA|mmetsp:Transcript_5045/g.10957  ORF Transcript_5045/g.10957 Transcript_5045/m.10957 type:complete len:318 (+) Transcript_5045:500-1453(+)